VVPLLVGSPLLQFVDRVVLVDCGEDLQIQRLLARDAETVEQARRMIAAQSTREERLAIADHVVNSDSALQETRRQVQELDRLFRDMAARKRARS
jgi:dephospho-CoA kinase